VNDLAVVVPVKGKNHKTRLASLMPPDQREDFSLLLLADLLRVILKAKIGADTFVVSSSARMLRLGQSQGAAPIREESDVGVNGAVARALSAIKGYGSFMVLPADLPLLQPSDLERATALLRTGFDVVLSPSERFNGTNLLLASTATRLRLSYDRDSFWNHLCRASRLELRVAVYATSGVLLDVDTPDDVRRIAETRIRRRSISFLRRMVRKE
jgi:2-phospho-L-lactate guanylyltransferase